MEARDENPIDAVIEMCVYAPLGFALEARSLLPRFVERGRNQVAMARVVGKFAARKGREGLEERVGDGHALVKGLLELTGVVDGAPDTSQSAPSGNGSDPGGRAGAVRLAGETSGSEAGGRGSSDVAGAQRSSGPEKGSAEAGAPTRAADPAVDAPAEDALAIPGYGSLAASQVVPRLASLSADELDAVRRYETANRARRTILNRIAQLQSS